MPPADTAVRLAAALGVTVEYLVKGPDYDKEIPSFFYSNPKKRSLLRIFDDLLPEDQSLTLDFIKILKKNREKEKNTTLYL